MEMGFSTPAGRYPWTYGKSDGQFPPSVSNQTWISIDGWKSKYISLRFKITKRALNDSHFSILEPFFMWSPKQGLYLDYGCPNSQHNHIIKYMDFEAIATDSSVA